MSDTVRIGIIGCGIGSEHADAYALDERARMISLAGLDLRRCPEIQRKHNIPHLYAEYADLLHGADIDAVSICLPNDMHLPVTLAALDAGKHVLIEKPIGLSSHEGAEMVAAAKAAGKVLGIAFSKRHRHDVELLKQQVIAGQLGRVYHAKAFWWRRSGIPGIGSWFTDKERSGGGALIDIGIHVLDMVLWLMGNPTVTAVTAASYSELGPQGKGQWQGGRFKIDLDSPFEVDDYTTAFLRTAEGATIQVDAAWAAYTHHTDEMGVSLLGSKGGGQIHVRDYQKDGALTLFSDINGIPADTQPRITPQHEHFQVIRRFIDAITLGVPMSPSGEEGLDRARITDAIYASARDGREIEIQRSTEPGHEGELVLEDEKETVSA